MERSENKREIILSAALTLFSEKGYDGTGVDEIAAACGMKGPALYHYFKSKDAVLDGIIDSVTEHYKRNFGNPENLRLPESMEELIGMSMNRIDFTIHDEQIRKARKMFAMEQFRNEKLRRLTTKHHITDVERIHEILLSHLMEKGIIKKCDPKMLAFEFTAPITLMIHLIDREPEREKEATERIRAYMSHFAEVYSV